MAFRVLTGELAHETNTFSILRTGLDAFRRGALLTANEIPAARRGTKSSIGATFEAADEFGWSLTHPILAHANPSGLVTDEAFEYFAGLLLAAAPGMDGILLHLHGEMVTESHQDGEGE